MENAGQVVTVNSQNITVMNLELSNASVGVEFWNTSNSRIENCTISNNDWDGIDLESSSNNTIANNTISNNDWDGIDLESSSNNSLSRNNVSNNRFGISLNSSSGIQLFGNIVSNNSIGIFLWDCKYSYGATLSRTTTSTVSI